MTHYLGNTLYYIYLSNENHSKIRFLDWSSIYRTAYRLVTQVCTECLDLDPHVTLHNYNPLHIIRYCISQCRMLKSYKYQIRLFLLYPVLPKTLNSTICRENIFTIETLFTLLFIGYGFSLYN